MNSSTATRTVTFEVPDQTRITEVQAEVTRVIEQECRSIIRSTGGRGQTLTFKVTFGNTAEVQPATHAAHLAALHVTPCEMRVR
jgi:hypothetical protein